MADKPIQLGNPLELAETLFTVLKDDDGAVDIATGNHGPMRVELCAVNKKGELVLIIRVPGFAPAREEAYAGQENPAG